LLNERQRLHLTVAEALFFGVTGADPLHRRAYFNELIMSNRKTWFVSYRLQPRPVRAGHARTSKTFGSESEAKAFARELPSAISDVTAGTINPHVPKKFYGSADIFKWLADDPSGVDPEGN
jgi:hypothetical protein